MSKSLKNFSIFLKENWSNKLEEFVDDVVEDDDNVSDNNISGENVDASEEETDTEDAKDEQKEIVKPSVEHTSVPSVNSVNTECKVVFLSGVVSTIGKENVNSIISAKLKDKLCSDNCKDVQLFQLNIQPASEGDEPMDGMVQVYDAVKEADAIIVCSDLKKGQISSVLQTTLERLSNHFKNKELRNKVFGSVITGEEDAHQSVKSSLLNFANNMAMIVGGDCNVFCPISEGETLGDCDNNFETDTTSASTCIKELCHATASIRGTVETMTPLVDDTKPTAISTILNFDNFENKEDENSDDSEYDDDGEEEEDDETETEKTSTEEDSKLNNFDEFDGEEENFEDDDESDEKSMEEEEEGYYYDYNNNICNNRTETPMTKPNPVKLTNESNGCGKKGCENCKCKKTNESSLLNFSKFMNQRKK